MTPEEANEFAKYRLDIDKFPKLMFNIDILHPHYPHFTLPVVLSSAHDNTIDTIIVIAPTKGSFAHFTDACRKSDWVRPDGIVKQNHIRAEQHVKNYVDNYVICVAKILPSDYPVRGSTPRRE